MVKSLIFYHMSFCPLSRKIFLGLREKNLSFQEVLEKTWDPSLQVFHLNRTGELPVLKADQLVCPNDWVALEYLEELCPLPSLMGKTLSQRVAVRSVVSWFDHVFYQDVYLTLFYEKAIKRHKERKGPDTDVLKSGRKALREAMTMINQIMEKRTYVDGISFSWADMAALAHLSCVDYLGEISWDLFPAAKEWYVKTKSRPSFRPLLAQTFPGLPASPSYSNLDF